MFLDRRSLLQSAAALLVPPVATIPRSASVKHQRALDRYIETFTAYFVPYRPDAPTEEAHDRADEDRARRDKAWQAARNELERLVREHHGMDGDDEIRLSALSLDVGDITVVVGPDVDDGHDDAPFGSDRITLTGRTAEARARLDAIKTFDPHGYENDEERERLSVKCEPSPPLPIVDMSRMAEGLPVPLTATITRDWSSDWLLNVRRTWKPADAVACERCSYCPYKSIPLDASSEKPVACQVTVDADEVERVLYGPHPEMAYDGDDWEGVLSDTHSWQTENWDVHERRTILMTRAGWEAADISKDARWNGLPTECGTMVIAFCNSTGPIPAHLWKLWGDVPREEPAQVEPSAAV